MGTGGDSGNEAACSVANDGHEEFDHPTSSWRVIGREQLNSEMEVTEFSLPLDEVCLYGRGKSRTAWGILHYEPSSNPYTAQHLKGPRSRKMLAGTVQGELVLQTGAALLLYDLGFPGAALEEIKVVCHKPIRASRNDAKDVIAVIRWLDVTVDADDELRYHVVGRVYVKAEFDAARRRKKEPESYSTVYFTGKAIRARRSKSDGSGEGT